MDLTTAEEVNKCLAAYSATLENMEQEQIEAFLKRNLASHLYEMKTSDLPKPKEIATVKVLCVINNVI